MNESSLGCNSGSPPSNRNLRTWYTFSNALTSRLKPLKDGKVAVMYGELWLHSAQLKLQWKLRLNSILILCIIPFFTLTNGMAKFSTRVVNMKIKRNIIAVIQAGGPGTRMGVKSEMLPKHLLPVGGVPMVERLFRQLLSSGIRNVYIITGHMGEKVEAHFQGLEDLPSDLELSFIRETTKRGDIGSLAAVPIEGAPVIWVYGDLVTNIDFATMVHIHQERRCDITLASHYESHKLSLGELLVEENRVLRYIEKPVKRFLICSGIAVIEPHVISLIDKAAPMGLDELVEKAIKQGFFTTHWLHGAFWIDVNDPKLLQQAEKALAKQL
jgi:NDP-sugar pyrophosphorylase family protein